MGGGGTSQRTDTYCVGMWVWGGEGEGVPHKEPVLIVWMCVCVCVCGGGGGKGRVYLGTYCVGVWGGGGHTSQRTGTYQNSLVNALLDVSSLNYIDSEPEP